MTKTSFPWASVAGDRTRTAAEAATIYAALTPTCVLDGLVVTVDGSNLAVSAGSACIEGHYFISDAAESLTPTASMKAYVVLKLDTANRTVTLELHDGSASALPELSRAGAIYEIGLASVDTTGAGLVVTDTRFDPSLCGLFSRPGIDTGIISISPLMALTGQTSWSPTTTVRRTSAGVQLSIDLSSQMYMTGGVYTSTTAVIPTWARPAADITLRSVIVRSTSTTYGSTWTVRADGYLMFDMNDSGGSGVYTIDDNFLYFV